MALINAEILILALSTGAILFSETRWKGIIMVFAAVTSGLLSCYAAFGALTGTTFEILLAGPAVFGNIPVKVDSLSGWFIITINITFITGSVYGFGYLKRYRDRKNDLTVHYIAMLLAQFSLTAICSVQHAMVFLILWEVMALSVFAMVIFDHQKPGIIKAGLNYLVQSHISIVLIMLGFIYVAYKTNNYSFSAITEFARHQTTLAGTVLFLFFFTGFAIKAGFVPFHTWLPYAHPAAPSHVSGMMSGVVIKIGIYGMLRMLLLIKTDYLTIGYIILTISIITGIYGVMLAIIQHNLKRLLAYHSIENIGIIGIGIGVGCIGLGTGNKWMAILGFSGALLHTLNHSLFKSLLFFSAGNVLQAAHTADIDRLGGLFKKMPSTALLFLGGAVAICGLPPLNGFISEFLIYGGLYNWLFSAGFISQTATVFALIALVLIGGLAILCFTKAFSIVFLGNPRTDYGEVSETGFWQLLPMYLIFGLMVTIGLFPSVFLRALQLPVNLFTQHIGLDQDMIKVGTIESLKTVNWLFLSFIALVLLFILLKRMITVKKPADIQPTWGCGYAGQADKMQYTAGSFVKSYSKLAKPVLDIEKKNVEITGTFPRELEYSTQPYDKVERILIDKPLSRLNRLTDRFLFLQNGQLQRYILYGIAFIAAVITIPLVVERIITILHFLNNI